MHQDPLLVGYFDDLGWPLQIIDVFTVWSLASPRTDLNPTRLVRPATSHDLRTRCDPLPFAAASRHLFVVSCLIQVGDRSKPSIFNSLLSRHPQIPGNATKHFYEMLFSSTFIIRFDPRQLIIEQTNRSPYNLNGNISRSIKATDNVLKYLWEWTRHMQFLD